MSDECHLLLTLTKLIDPFTQYRGDRHELSHGSCGKDLPPGDSWGNLFSQAGTVIPVRRHIIWRADPTRASSGCTGDYLRGPDQCGSFCDILDKAARQTHK